MYFAYMHVGFFRCGAGKCQSANVYNANISSANVLQWIHGWMTITGEYDLDKQHLMRSAHFSTATKCEEWQTKCSVVSHYRWAMMTSNVSYAWVNTTHNMFLNLLLTWFRCVNVQLQKMWCLQLQTSKIQVLTHNYSTHDLNDFSRTTKFSIMRLMPNLKSYFILNRSNLSISRNPFTSQTFLNLSLHLVSVSQQWKRMLQNFCLMRCQS